MITIAIDGPAGAGKSTIARAAAKKLGFIYVDTGALYRTVALKFISKGVLESTESELDDILAETSLDIRFKDGEQHVFLDGEDVSDKIRTPEISMAASSLSALPKIRAFLLEMQRKLARENNVLMDGRDIGTVVLPDATVKIFLTASVKERATRRYKELIEKGENVTFEEVEEDIKTRDYNDSHRAIAPLKPADDAITVDTTGIDRDGALTLLISVINERLSDK